MSFIATQEREELAQLVHAYFYLLEHIIIFQTALNFLELEGSLIIKEFLSLVKSGLYIILKLFTKIKLFFLLK